ncbi:MAG: hypothetical protein EA001_00270 [Oscillatoriales cyanobacterium]|nr:MAG: hypothetical protein EA001_00270 [Oscillatoriales cyanobacterium]
MDQTSTMSDSQPPIENWQGLNVKGGQNDIHDNRFVKQQGIIANDQATINIDKVEQNFGPQPPQPTGDGPPNNLGSRGGRSRSLFWAR